MKKRIVVWDLFIRVFHWTLATAFITSYLTGDENETLHIYSGYLILSLVLLRILWGVVGTQYARFSNFIRPPAQAFDYLKGLYSGRAPRYLGHNPAGGWMAILLLAGLLLATLSGLKLYGVEGHGPFAIAQSVPVAIAPGEGQPYVGERYLEEDDDEYEEEESEHHRSGGDHAYSGHEDEHEDDEDEAAEEFWEEVHELFVNMSLLLVVLHLAGVLLSSIRHRENLPLAMINGYKDES